MIAIIIIITQHNICLYLHTGPNNIEVIDEPYSYLPCSILMLLCCCPLFGFVALIYSFQVSDSYMELYMWLAMDENVAIIIASCMHMIVIYT